MLLIDGAEYKLWTPEDEENEFHPMVKEHSKEIFGKDSVYFDVKHKLKSRSGIASIPDAYVITLSKPYKWYIVENELASHPVYSHIFPQISKFISGIENLKSQRDIINVLDNQIMRDKVLKATVETKIHPEETHRFLSSLVSKPPIIAVIIDEETDEVKTAVKALKKLGHIELVEFKTYVRKDAPKVHAHLFEPIRAPERPLTEVRVRTGEITPQADYTLPILEALIEMGGSGKMSEVLDRVFAKLRDQLKPKDLEKLPSETAIRWKNKAQWERQRLKSEGYLRTDSPRGVWEITDRGRGLYKSSKERDFL